MASQPEDIRDLVTRNDERVKAISCNQSDMARRLEGDESRIDDLESETQKLRQDMDGIVEKMQKSEGWWNRAFDETWKIVLTILAAIILYMLNIK
jgi:hypothetical protein